MHDMYIVYSRQRHGHHIHKVSQNSLHKHQKSQHQKCMFTFHYFGVFIASNLAED